MPRERHSPLPERRDFTFPRRCTPTPKSPGPRGRLMARRRRRPPCPSPRRAYGRELRSSPVDCLALRSHGIPLSAASRSPSLQRAWCAARGARGGTPRCLRTTVRYFHIYLRGMRLFSVTLRLHVWERVKVFVSVTSARDPFCRRAMACVGCAAWSAVFSAVVAFR